MTTPRRAGVAVLVVLAAAALTLAAALLAGCSPVAGARSGVGAAEELLATIELQAPRREAITIAAGAASTAGTITAAQLERIRAASREAEAKLRAGQAAVDRYLATGVAAEDLRAAAAAVRTAVDHLVDIAGAAGVEVPDAD